MTGDRPTVARFAAGAADLPTAKPSAASPGGLSGSGLSRLAVLGDSTLIGCLLLYDQDFSVG